MSKGYDYNFLCTYQHLEDEKEADLCYKLQFLQAFNMEEYNSEEIENITELLYKELKEIDSFMELIKKIKSKMESKMNYTGFLNGIEERSIKESDLFCFVFCFEYFYKFHREYSLYKNNKNYNFDFIF